MEVAVLVVFEMHIGLMNIYFVPPKVMICSANLVALLSIGGYEAGEGKWDSEPHFLTSSHDCCLKWSSAAQ